MSENKPPVHFVCTWDDAEQLIKSHKQFWVSNCGCRERKGECQRSKMDVCLMFMGDDFASGSGKREISLAEANAILDEAKAKHLVSRPFRDNESRTKVEGICFCCDDCCGYFLDQNEICDKGQLIEKTDLDACTQCGDCEEICYFMARMMKDGSLMIDREACYGCGLCASICPPECIEMISRIQA